MSLASLAPTQITGARPARVHDYRYPKALNPEWFSAAQAHESHWRAFGYGTGHTEYEKTATAPN